MKKTNNKKIKLVTHNGSFHADDVFACATLSLMLEKKGKKVEVIRTRDKNIIQEGDYIFDVGGIYNPKNNRFDHHQSDFRLKRKNGIPYSSFGLVWKKFGKEISGSSEIQKYIDEEIAQSIDALDNGVDLYKLTKNIKPYSLNSLLYSFRPSWLEEQDFDKPFLKMVSLAKEILKREIKKEKDNLIGEKGFLKCYKNSKDKRVVVLDEKYPWHDFTSNYKNILFVISPRVDGTWGVNAVRRNVGSFENRKNFPKSWGGLIDEKLQKVTRVSDAVFCHKGLFLAVAKSKTGAIKLAELALRKKN